MAIERIDGAGDPRVADFVNVRDRDLAGRRGLFLAEGEVVVRVLATRSTRRIRSVLLGESRVDALRDVIDALPVATPVYVAPQPVVDAIVGFDMHRGVLAAGERGPELNAPQALAAMPDSSEALAAMPDSSEALAAMPDSSESLVVVLEGLTNHDNVGGVFRNAAAFGARCVLLDAATCDPLYRKAIRVSAGATLLVPYARASIDEACAALRAAGHAIWALTPRPPSDDLDELVARREAPPRLAILLGTEGPGLTDHALSLADRRVCVRMAGGFDSLNVATTSGIALFGARHAQDRR